MVTENVNIRFRESGIRVIKRKIDEIGQAADRGARGVFLLQRAIFVLGGFGAIRGLQRQLDMLTNMENRLKLTTTSMENLNTVQSKLFDVARRSRSDLTAVSEIYSRTALSVKDLGISQRETIRFTESLTKASILSGASTQEANAALIQLSQGLASNRLSGDELRSVLEQLPFVADVIAKELGITRGELRKFGEEGKISAEAVLRAFRNAEEEIDRLFADTIPTIGQAFQVATTNFLEFLDRFDDATGSSEKVAKAIILVSENLDLVVKAAAGVAAAFAISFTANQVNRVLAYAEALKKTSVRATRFLEVEKLRAAGDVRRSQALAARTAAESAQIGVERAALAQQAQALRSQAAREGAYYRTLRAVQANTGATVGLQGARSRLAATNTQLAATELALRSSTAAGTAATGAAAAAQNALAGAHVRAGAASAAQGGILARLTARFPLLIGAIRAATAGLAGFSAAILANPIGLMITALVLAIGFIIQFGDQVKLTSDGVVDLQNFSVAAFQLIAESVGPVVTAIKDGFNGTVTNAISVVGKLSRTWLDGMIVIGSAVKAAMNTVIGVIVGTVRASIAAVELLPAAFDAAMARAMNAMVDIVEKGVKGILAGLDKIFTFIGSAAKIVGADNPFADLVNPDSIDLSAYRSTGATAGAGMAEAFQDEFNSAMGRDYVGDAFNSVIDPVLDRARQNDAAAQDDQRAARNAANANENVLDQVGENTLTGAGGDDKKGKKGKDQPSFIDFIREKEREIELLGLSTRARERATEMYALEDKLKRKLTATEAELADEILRSVQAAQTQSEVLESIIGPRERIAEQQEALNQLFADGRIGIEDYTVALREMNAAADAASGTMMGGFKSAIGGAIQSAGEFGQALGGFVVNAAGSASDAVVKFAQTGKFNIKSFFADLFSQLLKLAANQLFLSLIGGAFGMPGAMAGGVGGGGLLGFSGGGSIAPSGPGSSDTQVVQFMKRPDERVDILTPGQQRVQRQQQQEANNGNNSGGGGGSDIQIAVVLSEDDIARVMGSEKGRRVIIKGLEANSGAVKRIANK